MVVSALTASPGVPPVAWKRMGAGRVVRLNRSLTRTAIVTEQVGGERLAGLVRIAMTSRHGDQQRYGFVYECQFYLYWNDQAQLNMAPFSLACGP